MGSSFTVYQTFIGAMNEKIKRQLAISNPFVFRHIYNLKVCTYDTHYSSHHPTSSYMGIIS